MNCNQNQASASNRNWATINWWSIIAIWLSFHLFEVLLGFKITIEGWTGVKLTCAGFLVRSNSYSVLRSIRDALHDFVPFVQFKKHENTHWRRIILRKLQTKAFKFTNCITPSWVLFRFFKSCEWYQIAQSASYYLTNKIKVVSIFFFFGQVFYRQVCNNVIVTIEILWFNILKKEKHVNRKNED